MRIWHSLKTQWIFLKPILIKFVDLTNAMSSTLHWKNSWASQIWILSYLGKMVVAVYFVHLNLFEISPGVSLEEVEPRCCKEVLCFFRKKENLLVDLFVWWCFSFFVGLTKWWVFGLRLWHMYFINTLHMHSFCQSLLLPWPCHCQLQSFCFENCLTGLHRPYLICSISSQHSHVCVGK